MEIKVFKQEVADGVADVIRASASIAFTSEIVSDTSKWGNIAKASEDFIKNYKFAGDINTVDLHPFNSVLASSGGNKNLDWFLKEEIWKARYSPIHKPVNWMHNDEIIIGSMIGSVAIDKDRNVIPDDTPVDKLPDLFDIAVCAVIYKCFSSDTKSALVQEILEKISKGELFVSMECIFPSFDYVLIDAQGMQKIVARNEETSFLSKYLRQYGGEGTYDGHQIGRVLRNLVFTGKGIVDKPANPRSIIFDDLEAFTGSQASIKVEKNMELETLKAELAKAQAEAVALKAANEKFNAKAQEELAKEIETLKVKVAEVTKASEDKNIVIKTQEEAIAAAEVENKKIKAENEEFKAEAEKAKKEKKKSDRTDKLKKAGFPEDKVEATLTKFDLVSDEIFDDYVAVVATANKSVEKKEEKTVASTQADFSKADKLTDATLNTQVTDAGDDVAKTRASVASFLGNKVFKTTANIKDKE